MILKTKRNKTKKGSFKSKKKKSFSIQDIGEPNFKPSDYVGLNIIDLAEKLKVKKSSLAAIISQKKTYILQFTFLLIMK